MPAVEETGKDNARRPEPVQKVQQPEPAEVDTSDPAVEEAAVKIQAAYRGHKSRQDIKSSKEDVSQDASVDKTVEEAAQPEPAASEPAAPEPAEPEPTTTEPPAPEAAAPETTETTEKSEEIDIDLNDPATEAAAVKIQASFRGFKSRQELKESQTTESAEAEAGGETVTTEISTEVEVSTETGNIAEATTDDTTTAEEPAEPAEDDSATQEAAAIRIQSSFRGHKVRKEMKASKTNTQATADEINGETEAEAETEVKETEEEKDETSEVVNVDSVEDSEPEAQESSAVDESVANGDDEEATNAAIKIQAGFRGHKVRKSLKAKAAEEATTSEATEEPPNDDGGEGN